MVAIEDSVGYVEAINQIFENIGIEALDTIAEWADRKDREAKRLKKNREKREIKLKRVQKRRADLEAGIKASKKSKKSGADYGSGIGINNPSIAAVSVTAFCPPTSSSKVTTQ